MRPHDDQIGLSGARFFRNDMKGVARSDCDIAGWWLAEARDLLRQIILSTPDFIAHPVFEQVILDHMQNTERCTGSFRKLHPALDSGFRAG